MGRVGMLGCGELLGKWCTKGRESENDEVEGRLYTSIARVWCEGQYNPLEMIWCIETYLHCVAIVF